VRQIDFARTLARVLRRPCIAPLPAGIVRLLFGSMGDELLLGGSRVNPAALTASGYPFLFSDLESALRFELGRLECP
jgi:NAD dependent epimerase/dehydratase family enzyme